MYNSYTKTCYLIWIDVHIDDNKPILPHIELFMTAAVPEMFRGFTLKIPILPGEMIYRPVREKQKSVCRNCGHLNQTSRI